MRSCIILYFQGAITLRTTLSLTF